jgi:hypothetical protein
MSEQNPLEFPKDDHTFLPNHPPHANDQECRENVTYQQAPTFDDFHGSFNHFTLPSSPYDRFDNAGTLVNYQHAFQPLEFDPQYHMHAYSGAYSSSMIAPTGFYNPPIPEQPWVDEIHPSYTPVGSENFDWTPSNARSHSWLVDIPFTNPAEQAIYANTPTTLPVYQYPPSKTTTPEGLIAQRFVSESVPRPPLQQALSTRPASVALKVRNEKFKKEITTLLCDNAVHNTHKPMRVSKTKKAENADNNVKQEACWRCKRYRKAVSYFLCSRILGLMGQVHWPGYLQRMLDGWFSSLAVRHRLQEGSDGGFCRENNAL